MTLKDSFAKTKIIILGYGIIARSFLNVLDQITEGKVDVIVIDSSLPDKFDDFQNIVIRSQKIYVNESNFRTVLENYFDNRSICINFSTNISSMAVAALCLENAVSYLDTANNSWKIEDLKKNPSQFEYNELINAFKKKYSSSTKVFSILNFGMNPGLISFVAKSLLDEVAISNVIDGPVKIHLTEVDHQFPETSDGFYGNTWSLEAISEEFLLPAEHFRNNKIDADKLAIDSAVTFRSLSAGLVNGYVVPHREVFSINKWISESYPKLILKELAFVYAPNVSALKFIKQNINDLKNGNFESYRTFFKLNRESRWINGFNEVGVRLESEDFSVFKGFRLSSSDDVCKKYKSNPTALLVAGSAIIGLIVAFKYKLCGVFEAEDMFFLNKEVGKLSIDLFGPNANLFIIEK